MFFAMGAVKSVITRMALLVATQTWEKRSSHKVQVALFSRQLSTTIP